MRRLLALLSALALSLGLLSLMAQPAQALQPPVAFTSSNLPTWQANGVVWKAAQAQGLVFVGGSFTSIRPPGAAAGVSEVARSNFAVLDAATGNPTSCAPAFTLNDAASGASIRSLNVSPDGSTLYIGGYFSKVNGVFYQHVVALTIATCSINRTFKPLPGGMVHSIVSTPTTVYLGGAFVQVASQPRLRAAAVSAVGTGTPGALLPWAPGFDIEVTSLGLKPDGTQMVVGGRFNNANGVDSHALAVIDAITGANIKTYPLGFISQTSVVKDISVDSTGFYTSNEGTGGGVFDGRIAMDWSTLDQRWRDTCLGATQSTIVYRGILYSASHAHDCSSMGSFPDGPRYHLLAQSVDDPTLLPWFPNTNEGIGEQIGPRSLVVAPTPSMDYMWVVGEFTQVNGVAQQSLTRFGQGPDTARPSIPTVSLNPFRPGQVQVNWRTSLDTDDALLTYSVYRDNSSTPLYTTTATSWFWNRPSLSFIDTGLALGSKHTYRVSASDGTNTVYTPWRSVTISSTVSAYAERVASDGADLLWRYDEPSDAFFSDYTGRGNGGTLTGPAIYQVSPAAIAADPSRAITLPGTGSIYSNTPTPSPNAFTTETWFKTGTTSGGKIIGFGNSQTGNSGNYDKHLYMTDDGKLVFGVWNGYPATIKTANSFNDNTWHHVVATQGPSGMVLYVDGVKVGRNGTSTNQAYDGYWRVGGDNLNGWPDQPSSNNFAGSIDETAVYPTTLSAATVADHFVLAGGTLPPSNTGPSDFYGNTVFNDAPALFWRLGESSGPSAADASGSDHPAQYSSGVTYGSTGAVDGTSDGAVTLDGTSEGLVSQSTATGSPGAFSAEAWIKTTTDSGGKIIGFGDNQTGASGSYDKHVYMTDDGRLVFGVYVGYAATITSSASYKDGDYHHVVATQGPDGMALWVDGALIGTNPVNTSQEYGGYWRVGGDSLGGWPDQPTSSSFAGTIDEVAVYHDVLNADQVATHYSAGRSAVADVAAPTTSQGLTAAVSLGSAQLTWQPAIDNVGVTGYDVYRSQTLGFAPSPATFVDSTATASYTDSSAAPGTWYYRVVAKDAAGNRSQSSSQVSVTLTDTAAPSTPSGLTAPATSTSATLSWTASTDNVGVVAYDVYRSATNGFVPGPSSLLTSVVTTSHVNTPLALGTWYYRVVARDAAGNASGASSQATATVVDSSAPTAPLDLVTTPSAGAVGLNWSASSDDVGVTAYRVYRSATNGFAPSPSNQVGSVAGRSFVDSPVNAGTWYYRVDARDSTGNASTASPQVAAVVAPTTVTSNLTPSADTYANQGAAATNFGSSTSLAALSSPGAVSYLRFAIPVAPPGTSLTGAALLTRTTTIASAGTTGSPVVRLGSDSWTESTLNWSNRPAVSGAVLGSIAAGTVPNTVYTTVLDPAALQGVVGPSASIEVSNPTADSFWFWSSNHATASFRPQLRLTFTPLDIAAPSTPTDVQATVSGYSAAITWQQSLDNVGVTGYDVYRSSAAGFTPDSGNLIGSTAPTALSDNGLAPGTWYYRVVAKDAASNRSAASAELAVVIADGTPPSTPTGFSATADSTSTTLSWNDATDNVGVVEYDVHRSTSAAFTPSPATMISAVSTPGYLDSPLAFGTWYYRVVARDAAGNSSPATAAIAAVVSDTTAPTSATNLDAVATSGGDVDVTWSAASDDVGVTGYDVYRSSASGFTPSPANKIGSANSPGFTDASVPAGTWYYRVVAKDAAGNRSEASDEASLSVADDESPSAPVGLSTTVNAATVTVSWTAATDNVGVVGYDIHRSSTAGFTPLPANKVGTSSGTTFDDSPPSIGTWSYRVVARDATGNESAPSAQVTAVLNDLAPPSAPTAVTASASGSTVDVAWTAATDDVAVTGYDVYRSETSGFTPSPATKIGSVNTTSFTDTAVPAGTWYYRVVAKDAIGNRSSASNVADTNVADTTAPTAAGSLSATVSSSTVTLLWTVATDNVAVTGYDVYRSATSGFTPSPATKIGSANVPGFTDTAVPSGTWYYRVVATDAANNAGPASNQATAAGVGGPPTVVTLTPTADTFANSAAPTTNYGLSASLASLSGPANTSYLRFVIPAAPAGKTLTAASLRVRTTTDAAAGAVGSLTVRLGSDTWTESTLTWNNRPTATGAVLGSIAAGTVPNTVYTTALDPSELTPLVGAQGTIAITNPATDSLWFWSRNHASASYRPQLALTYS